MSGSFYQAKTPEEAIELYFQAEKELYSQIKNKIIQEMLDVIYGNDLWNSLEVLEVGAGGGIWTDFFINKGAHVTCIDNSVQILKGNEILHPQAKFVLGDAANVKLDRQFSLVFAKDVIEHIQEDGKFLRNMNCHLKKDGLLTINTQNSLSLNFLIQGSYHFLRGNKTWRGWDPTHVRFYNKWSLGRKIKAAGFKPIHWFGSYYLPYRILCDRLGIRKGLKLFNSIELLHLYNKFPFNITGWNIGVIARKTNTSIKSGQE